MQIHELNNFTGTPTSSDYLAIDNSTTTTKIGATGLGVQDKLTVAETNTGTSTASRIVTPKVVHDYVVQDTTHITSATKSSWASVTGNDGSIDDIADYLEKHQLKIESIETENQTITANGGTKWYTGDPPTGAIGIVGYYINGTNGSRCIVYSYRIETGGTYAVALCNTYSSAVTVKLELQFLCYTG